jgi:hypothetical protein
MYMVQEIVGCDAVQFGISRSSEASVKVDETTPVSHVWVNLNLTRVLFLV